MNFRLLFSLLFISLSWYSQAQKNYVREANRAYRSGQFSEATAKCALAYTKIARKTPAALKQKGEMAFKTAESYRQLEMPKEAAEWYEKAILLKYDKVNPELLFHNGEMYRTMGDFPKAKKNYEAYKQVVPDDERATNGLISIEKNADFKANKTRHIIANETKLNEDGFDMAPMIGDKKSNSIMYGSSKPSANGSGTDLITGESYMNIWVAEMDKKGNWTAPKMLDDAGINTEDNEGTVCFDGKYKTMFFTRCPNEKKQNLGCEIWMSEATSGKWGKPEKLNLKDNDTISVGHPCVSEDGKFLIFASDMPGGFGGRDLWYTTYDKKTGWSTPQNMGPGINTPGNELFPTLSLSGDLFYATDGLPGLGGLDMFKATRVGTENKWESPENLGFPLNSESNDYAIVELDERRGYFTSERKGSKGKTQRPDIWNYKLEPNVFDLKVIVSELGKKSKKIADLQVKVTGSDGSAWEGYTNKQGQVFWDKKTSGERYINENTTYKIVLGSKKGYKDNTAGYSFTTVGLMYDQSFVVELEMIPEGSFRLPEVRYPFNQWSLLVDSTFNSKDSLMYVYNLLMEYPTMVLELSSHTDSRGDNEYNRRLADNRAHQCYIFLIDEKGIDPRRIVPIGRGEMQPRVVYKKGSEWFESAPEDMTGVETITLTEAYINKFKADKALFERLHQFNRRTEARVITMEFDAETAPPAPASYKEFVKLK